MELVAFSAGIPKEGREGEKCGREGLVRDECEREGRGG